MFLPLHKDWLKTLSAGGRLALSAISLACLALFILMAGVSPAAAQTRAPRGTYIQVGPAFASGIGLNVGAASAKTLYTREIQFITDLQPVFSGPEDQARIAALIGFSIRVFGFERLLGNAAYRGFDIDVGLRVGPRLTFSTRDSRFDKNRRFLLVAEPMVRFTRATARFIGFAELGTDSPHARIGIWIPW